MISFDTGLGYFKYAAHNTAHIYEAHLGYDFGFLALNWFTNFAGNDGVTPSGKRAYSSYAEISAPFRIAGLDFSAEIGASSYATTSYNANGFAVIDRGLGAGKSFRLTDRCDLNVFTKAIFNPRNDKGYLLVGASFAIE